MQFERLGESQTASSDHEYFARVIDVSPLPPPFVCPCSVLIVDLTEPIDVYTDWIDECEAVNAVGTEQKSNEQFIDERELAEG